MPREHDNVALTRNFSEQGLAAGDIGAIVHIYPDGLAFEVEFMTLTGRTIAVETLPVDAVRPVRDEEIAHVRKVAAE